MNGSSGPATASTKIGTAKVPTTPLPAAPGRYAATPLASVPAKNVEMMNSTTNLYSSGTTTASTALPIRAPKPTPSTVHSTIANSPAPPTANQSSGSLNPSRPAPSKPPKLAHTTLTTPYSAPTAL